MIKSTIFTFALFASCYASCPTIRDYGGMSPTAEVAHSGAWSKLMIRGGKGYTCTSISNCSPAIQNLQSTDMFINKLPDIDCNFVIGGDGYAYEGRGWVTSCSEYPDHLVYCVLENPESGIIPDTYQEESLKDLTDCAIEQGYLTSNYILETPRDLDPSSVDPPQDLYDWVQLSDHYVGSGDDVVGK